MTGTRPGARWVSGRLTPALCLLLSVAACQAADEPVPPGLRATETIIGRASWRGQDMLLSDAPALVSIDRATGELDYTPIATPSDVRFVPWGLAEADDALLTISEFVHLTRVTTTGSLAEVATLDRPVANLVDLPDGMAAQLSSQPAGSPLVVSLNGVGRISPLESPARAVLGLTPAEESLLHLITCSAPPRVICWLPNENRLLAFDGDSLADAAILEGVDPIPAATLISRPDRRVIIDAAATDDGRFVVLLAGHGGASQQVATFDARGRRLASAPAPEPLRLLIASGAGEILAISRRGKPIRIWRP